MYSYNSMPNTANPNIVSYARGDVNGDLIPDNVYLTGFKESDTSRVQNITLAIQDGATGAFTNIPLKENSGYDPALFLGDFTADRTDDILISIATGGSGGTGYYYIYSFVDNIPRLMFDYDVYNKFYQYSVTYKDNYKVEVISKVNNTRYLIDISLRGPDYLDEIYYKNGKLKNPINGWVDPISGLYPVDRYFNKVYALIAYQQIAGRYHADSLGYVQNTLMWKNGRFVLDNQVVAIFGSQG